MNLVWLKSDYVDPPDTGGKLRTYNLLRELCKRCDVTYISLTSDPRANGSVPVHWASRVATSFRPEEKKSGLAFHLRVLMRMFSPRPYIVRKYLCRKIQNFQKEFFASSNAKQVSPEHTVLVCDFLEMTGNVVRSTPCPKILFEHNVESVIWRRYAETETNWLKRAYFWFEFQRLVRYERNACNRFDLVLAVSEKDRATLEALGVTAPIEVIDTGVDIGFFGPQRDVVPAPGRLLFLGSLDWMPNIDSLRWFVADIYPRIKRLYPGVTLDVVGRRPVPFIAGLPVKDGSIRVFSDVPDVRPYIASADVFAVPLRAGSGTRLKIFEAMAMARPVVSTTIGAEGLPLDHGRHILVADSAAGFARQVVDLIVDRRKNKAIADNGYRLVTEKYSWETVSQRFYEACLDIHGKHE